MKILLPQLRLAMFRYSCSESQHQWTSDLNIIKGFFSEDHDLWLIPALQEEEFWDKETTHQAWCKNCGCVYHKDLINGVAYIDVEQRIKKLKKDSNV